MEPERADHAKRVIDANRYMTLGTADAAGHPWVSPVWFASQDYYNFHWISSPHAKHSRNLAARPDTGRGWQLDNVQGHAPFRLYRATISEHWVLIRGSDPLRGSGVDRSERVSLD